MISMANMKCTSWATEQSVLLVVLLHRKMRMSDGGIPTKNEGAKLHNYKIFYDYEFPSLTVAIQKKNDQASI